MKRADIKKKSGEKRERDIKKEWWTETDREWGLKGWERHSDDKKKKNIDQKTGLARSVLVETNGGSSVSVYYSIYYMACQPLSLCACHARLLPMHDNYPAPDCVDNTKKKTQGSMRWHPASVGAQNFSCQQQLCASNTYSTDNMVLEWL